ncbi:MAG: hypothetical protein GXO26_07940 [Crenarchaeota archaeon]|nr:hypothetical protein [Thermoproteota archaeon]
MWIIPYAYVNHDETFEILWKYERYWRPIKRTGWKRYLLYNPEIRNIEEKTRIYQFSIIDTRISIEWRERGQLLKTCYIWTDIRIDIYYSEKPFKILFNIYERYIGENHRIAENNYTSEHVSIPVDEYILKELKIGKIVKLLKYVEKNHEKIVTKLAEALEHSKDYETIDICGREIRRETGEYRNAILGISYMDLARLVETLCMFYGMHTLPHALRRRAVRYLKS